MSGTTSLFNTFDTKNHTQRKVSISDGNNISLLGSGTDNVPSGTLKEVFHVQWMPTNLISIYCECEKGYKFEAWPNKYVLKDIKHNLKIVSSSLVDHMLDYKSLMVFNSSKNQHFYLYILLMLMNQVNYGMKD